MYSYDFSYDYPITGAESEISEVLAILVPIYAIMFLVFAVIGLAIYILRSIALTRLSQNRGFDNPWIGWIPFCSGYALGRISDDINIKRGKTTNHRKILLGTNIAVGALELIGLGVMIPAVVSLIQHSINYGSSVTGAEAAAPVLAGSFLIMIGAIVAIVYAVFNYIALYSVFKDYAPNNAVLYLVLSLLVGGSDTIILFIIRNKAPVPPMPPYGGYPYPPQQYGQYMPPQPPAGAPNGQPPQPGQLGQYMPQPPAGAPNGQPSQPGQFGQYMPPQPPAGAPNGQPPQPGQYGQYIPPQPSPSPETPKESAQDSSDQQ